MTVTPICQLSGAKHKQRGGTPKKF